ncbi:MAG TPA: 50S ribosomal protein L24 [Phycisphaerae bacterium]|nr:50S ribosomal protein L24 [Phycisphaerae bacterium]HUU22488.1 50S ribosomal protein L24 [Phycisphaerae bacterium]
MARHVRKGDTVIVIAGDDKGKTGEVLQVDTKVGKVLVQGVNRSYRHLRPSRKNPQGGRIQKEMPISISNVLPLDPKTNRPTRVGFRINEAGEKERYAKKSGDALHVLRPKK